MTSPSNGKESLYIKELKALKEKSLLNSVKDFTTTFGTGISHTLMKDTYSFVELELKTILSGDAEFNEDANLRIINGVFTRTHAACLLLDIVESSNSIEKINKEIEISEKLELEAS